MCAYCARLGAVENSELLALDGLQGRAPEVWAVLTTSKAVQDPEHYYEARRAVLKALKRRWPDVEYGCVTEFSTGEGRRSAGIRRPHFNLFLKGIPARDWTAASHYIVRTWCARPEVGAEPQAQYVGAIAEMGGLMRYLALHFQKESQQPPEGWHGHRFTRSRGYLDVDEAVVRDSKAFRRRVEQLLREGDRDGQLVELEDAEQLALRGCRGAAAREVARESLAFKREVFKAWKHLGLRGDAVEVYARTAREDAARTTWDVVRSGDDELFTDTLRPADREGSIRQLLSAAAWAMAAALQRPVWDAELLGLSGLDADQYVGVRRAEAEPF